MSSHVAQCSAICASGLQCSRKASTPEGVCGSHISPSECSICFNPVKRSGAITVACTHKFHLHCLAKWSERSETCPNCRKQLDPITMKKLCPDLLDEFSTAFFKLSHDKRQLMLNLIVSASNELNNLDNLDGVQAELNNYHPMEPPPQVENVFVPNPPADLYSYISLSDDVDDVDADPDFMV